MIVVTVCQADNKIDFGFNEQADAFRFADTCMECGEDISVWIHNYREERDECLNLGKK